MHRGLRVAQGDVHGGGPVTAIDELEDDGEYADLVVEHADLSAQRAVAATFDRVMFRSVSLTGAELAECQLTDVSFENCDLSGFGLLECSLMRVSFSECRVAGFTMSRGGATIFALSQCRGEGAALFGVDGKDWKIEDCELAEVDCRELRVADAVIERCDLTGADFTNAAVKATITDTVMERIGGAGGLSGSTIDVPTLMSAAPGLAKALGLRVL